MYRFKNLKSFIYNTAIKFTSGSYTEVLLSLEPNSKILDVGIGTAQALLKNSDVIKKQNLTVVGIDIDTAYLAEATQAVKRAGVDHLVTIQYGDICLQSYPQQFDAVYFSHSYMLIPKNDRSKALKNAALSLKSGNSILFFTQTYQNRHSALLEYIKPRIKFLTSINFGLVTYESEFLDSLKEAGIIIVSQKKLYQSSSGSMMLIATKNSVF